MNNHLDKRPMKRASYRSELTTMNQWEAAAIEIALQHAVQEGKIHREHGKNLVEKFRRFSQPECLIRFEKSPIKWRVDNHGRRYYEAAH